MTGKHMIIVAVLEADLDQVPGWGFTPASWIDKLKREWIGHGSYNPTVTLNAILVDGKLVDEDNRPVTPAQFAHYYSTHELDKDKLDPLVELTKLAVCERLFQFTESQLTQEVKRIHPDFTRLEINYLVDGIIALLQKR